MSKTNMLRFLFVVMSLTVLFNSCTMEKRHYRNGYYVQRASVTVNNHDSSPRTTTFPANFALTDSSESLAYEDAYLTDSSVRTVEKTTTDSSLTISQRHTSACQSKNVSEKNITRVQLARPYSQPNLDDGSGKEKHEQKSGSGLIVVGTILIALGILGLVLMHGIMFLLLIGVPLFIWGIRRKRKYHNVKMATNSPASGHNSSKKLKSWVYILIGVALVPVALFLVALIIYAADFGLQ